MTEQGWHPDPVDRHQHRYHDGTKWTDNVADNGVQTIDPISAEAPAATVTNSRQILEQWVQRDIGPNVRLESQTDTQAILVAGHRPNHLLHFFLGLFTLSLWWIFVWLPISAFGGERRIVYAVTPEGSVTRNGKPV